MVQDIFAIPLTSVASESTFSTARRLVDDYWSNHTLESIEMLICSQDWLNSVDESS